MQNPDFIQKSLKLLEKLLEIYEKDDELEVDLIDGILTINSDIGEYVINKHDATEQIWLSSPKTGATHFRYDKEKDIWLGTRGEGEIIAFLKKEL